MFLSKQKAIQYAVYKENQIFLQKRYNPILKSTKIPILKQFQHIFERVPKFFDASG